MKNKSSTFCKNFEAGPFRPGFDQRNTKSKRIAAVLAMGLGVTVAAIAFTQSSRAIPVASSQRPLLTVHTAAMNPVGYTVRRTFLGQVEAARSSDVGFELAGKISSIEVDEGDKVTKGKALAYLDIDRLQARREELVSALEQTQANLKLAEITYRRYQKIVASGGVSQQQMDEAKEHFRASQAAVQVARSRIKTIEVEIEKSRLEAPFDATVAQRRVDEGQVVSAGSPVLRLQENRAWEIRVGIAGPIVDSIEVGQVIPVVVNQLSFDASVKAIVPVRDGRSRTVDVILSLAKVASPVRSGDLVRVDLATTIEKSGYWIPLSALSEGARGLWSIYILERDSAHRSPARQTVRRRTIAIIHEESNRVFVQGDFEHDDRFVTEGLQRIVPGQLVQVSSSLARLNENPD